MKRREFLASSASALGLMMLGGGAPHAAPRPARRPNILFFFPDQHRFDWTSMNPALPDLTPNLKQLARRGVRFTSAITPSPLCAPARACLASGLDYSRCGVPSNGAPYPLAQPTVYTLLKNSGYHVLGCGKFDLDKPGNSWGADGQHQRPGQPSLLAAWGFSAGIDNEGKQDGISTWQRNPEKRGPYFDYLKRQNLVEAHLKNVKLIDHAYPGPSVISDEAYCDNWIARNGLGLIKAVPRGEPWFIQVNFNGPHPPMDVTKPMYEHWKETPFPPPWNPNGAANKSGSAGSRRNYGAMIHNIDAWLGRYLDLLRERGELDNTIIVYSSDHGEMLGDRGLSGKSLPWHPSACVPLVIAGPGLQAERECAGPVSTLDLTATFLDVAGIPVPQGLDSRTLKPYLEGKAPVPREVVTSALGGWRFAFDGRYKLIAGTYAGKEALSSASAPDSDQLFDLQTDPHESTNIAAQNPELVKRLAALLPPASAPSATTRPKAGRRGKKKARRNASA